MINMADLFSRLGSDDPRSADLACLLPNTVYLVQASGNLFLVLFDYDESVSTWSFLTHHARALVLIAHDPDARLRDLADALGVTERTAYGIVADLSDAGYVVKEKDGRRNRYHINTHLPLPDQLTTEHTIGEVLDVLIHSHDDADRRS